MKSKPSEPKTLSETKVKEVLSKKPPSLHPKDNVLTAGERMRSMDAGDWPVSDKRRLVGSVGERHPDRSVAAFGHDPRATLVGATMSRDVAYCYVDQNCEEALAIMDERGIKFLPVVDRQKRITGIVSREELIERCTAAPKDGK